MATTISTVPLRNDLPNYKFKVNLSNTIYSLQLRYNPRMSRWIMDINDSQNNPILSGVVLKIQTNLTGQYVTLPLPAGSFICLDNTQQGNQPTQFSFGLTHSMYYVDPTT